ncbi:MAG: hypothetical protein ACYDBV_13215, partial [Nitrospiria bacterium]
DPVLRGTITAVIQEENKQGRYISQEDALARANSLLSEKVKPQVKQAESVGFNEGQDLARAKEKMGAIGDTTTAAPPMDEDKLSAAEYAKLHNLSRHQG